LKVMTAIIIMCNLSVFDKHSTLADHTLILAEIWKARVKAQENNKLFAPIFKKDQKRHLWALDVGVCYSRTSTRFPYLHIVKYYLMGTRWRYFSLFLAPLWPFCFWRFIFLWHRITIMCVTVNRSCVSR